MKVDNLMKSLESDESRQPDEKLGKWWNLRSRWKVRKRWKNAISFTLFLLETFLCKRIWPKSCSLILRWPILTSKSNRRIDWKTKWKGFEQATKLGGNFEANCTGPLISTSKIAKHHFPFYFWILLSRAQVWIKPQMETLQRRGISLKGTYFDFHRCAKALKDYLVAKTNCIWFLFMS